MKLSPHCLTPVFLITGIRSLVEKSRLAPLFSFSALPPVGTYEAIPKDVSRRTSYHGVRLEFLRYPQLIHQFCTAGWFGPPVLFPKHSTWSWVAHPVSGTVAATNGLLILAFTVAPVHRTLTCDGQLTRWLILQ